MEDSRRLETTGIILTGEIYKAAKLLGIDVDVRTLTTQVMGTFLKMERFKIREAAQAFIELEDPLKSYNFRQLDRILAKCGFATLNELKPRVNSKFMIANQKAGFDPLSPYIVELAHLTGKIKTESGRTFMEAHTIPVAAFEFASTNYISNPHLPFFTYPNLPCMDTQIDTNAQCVINSGHPVAAPALYSL